MKKITSLLLCGVLLLSLAACGGKAPQDTFLYATNNRGKVIALGDTRKDAIKICSEDEKIVVDFEEENIERVEYWGDYEEIWFEYKVPEGRLEMEYNDDDYSDPTKPDDPIVSVRFKSTQWTFSNGLQVGSTVDQVKAQYQGIPQLTAHKQGYSISYDESLNPIDYDLYSPYRVDYRIENGRVTYIIFKDNVAAGTLGGEFSEQDIMSEMS